MASKFVGYYKWSRIKEKWEENTKSAESTMRLEANRKPLVESIKINKLKLLHHYEQVGFQDIKELYEYLNIQWKDKKEDRLKFLERELLKAEQRFNITGAEWERLKESDNKDTDGTFNQDSLDEAIASLEPHGYHIEDYDTITLRRYLAVTKDIRKKNGKRQN